MSDVLELIKQRMEEAAANIANSRLLDPPFCDLNIHRALESGLDISTCRDCGAVVVRACPCCDDVD